MVKTQFRLSANKIKIIFVKFLRKFLFPCLCDVNKIQKHSQMVEKIQIIFMKKLELNKI